MTIRRILFIILLLAALLLVATDAAVTKGLRSLNADLAWSVIGAGGGHAASASYSMEATLGQSFAGNRSASGATLAAGFWQDGTRYGIFLPIVLR